MTAGGRLDRRTRERERHIRGCGQVPNDLTLRTGTYEDGGRPWASDRHEIRHWRILLYWWVTGTWIFPVHPSSPIPMTRSSDTSASNGSKAEPSSSCARVRLHHRVRLRHVG